MAITIQELIASDTVSQAVDKINFNFDQLILNGGGPLGPSGPQGPAGPIGGRGERGTEWYEDDSVSGPGKNPNTFPPTLLPLKNDYYLQFNGQVWEYDGSTWVPTTVNLTGPAGPTGASVGLSQFGNSPNPGNPGGVAPNNYAQNAKNVGYPSLMAAGSQTISTDNQGVPTFAVGIAGPNDIAQYPNGVNVTTDFRLLDEFAGTLDSTNTSFLLHQKNSGATALRFMGGTEAGENFEQLDYTKLSQIKLSSDDTLNISVPKSPTAVSNINDTVGFNIETAERGQTYRSGAGFSFKTGTKGGSGSSFFNSNFEATVSTFSPLGSSEKGKFDLNTIGAGATTRFQMGGNDITIPTSTAADGFLLAEARKIELLSSSQIQLTAQSDAYIKAQGAIVAVDGNITLDTVATGDIHLTASGTGDIVLNSTGGGVNKITSSVSTNISTGVNFVTVDLASGIIANTQNASNNIDLIASGVSSDINILSTENITLGTSFADNATYPNINMVLNGSNKRTQYRGKETWGASFAPVPDNLVDAPVYKHEYTALTAPDAPILGGSVVRQMGAASYITNSGVIYQQYNDGSTNINIGKPQYNNGVLGGDRLGLFVNSTNETVPPQFSNNGAVKENPVQEQFRVDSTTTKISNNFCLGGENGHQVINLDPLWDATSINGRVINVEATTPHLQVNIGTFIPVNSQLAINSMPNAGRADWECDLILKFNPSEMVLGQRFTIEIYNMPSKFSWCGSSSCSIAEQYGRINVLYENLDNAGNITQKSAGSIETSSNDVQGFGSGTTTYTSHVGIYEFSFSNMGQKIFYNGNGTDAAGGLILQKGWTRTSFTLLTFAEENDTSYSMAPIINPVS